MFAYVIRRTIATIPVVAIVALFVFSLLYITPGDPAAVLAGDLATADDIARIRKVLKLDDPFLVRFGSWIWGVFQGDLGVSIFTNQPVTRMINQRMEPTLMLSLCTLVITVVFAVPMGVVAAWKAGTWIDRSIMAFAVLGFSVPVFVLAYLLILGFSIQLEWLPVQGYTQPQPKASVPFIRQHDPCRAIALGLVYMALIARITRATMLEVWRRTMSAPPTRQGPRHAQRGACVGHALKNAAVPIVTVIGIGIALLIGGVVVTETVFAIPGLGRLTVDAILRRDYPIIQGVVAAVLASVYVDRQPAGRPQLHAGRSADPLLMTRPPSLTSATPRGGASVAAAGRR